MSDNKFNIIVRLYRHTDLDLMALLDTNGFSLQLFTKMVLKSYADKKVYYVDIPKPDKISENERVKNERTYIVYFNKETDSEVIRLFDGIKKRYRNGFIKNVVRKYIFGSSLSCFFEDAALEAEYYNLQKQLGVPVITYNRLMGMKVHTMPDTLLASDGIRLETKDSPVTAIEDNLENTKNIIPSQQSNDIIENNDTNITTQEKREENPTENSGLTSNTNMNSKEDNSDNELSFDAGIVMEPSGIASEEEESEFEDMFESLLNS